MYIDCHAPVNIISPQMETEYDYLFKIVLIGDTGVGKTSIMKRYVEGTFSSMKNTTIGMNFRIKTLQIGGSAVKVRVTNICTCFVMG